METESVITLLEFKFKPFTLLGKRQIHTVCWQSIAARHQISSSPDTLSYCVLPITHVGYITANRVSLMWNLPKKTWAVQRNEDCTRLSQQRPDTGRGGLVFQIAWLIKTHSTCSISCLTADKWSQDLADNYHPALSCFSALRLISLHTASSPFWFCS